MAAQKLREFAPGIMARFVPPYYWEVSVDGEFVSNVDDGELCAEIIALTEELERKENKK